MIGFLRGGLTVVVAALVMQLLAPNSQAQTRGEQVEELKRQIEEIQRQNQQQIEELREKIESLEAQRETDKANAEELAAEKEEKDKDAWWKKIEVGYKKPGDGFKLKTKDGNFSLRTRLRTQFQFSVNDTDDRNTATNFDVRRLRLVFDGNAFAPWLLYTLQLEADSGSLSLLDAYFDFARNTLFVPRVGQYKVPFSREHLNSTSELQLVERSILDSEFRLGRDVGAGIYGILGDFLTYGAGVFNGDGRNANSADSNLLYAGRVMLTFGGDLEYGGSFPAGGDFKLEPNFGKEGSPLLAIGAAVAGIPGLSIDRKTPDSDIDDRFIEIFGADLIEAGDAEADLITATADINFKYSIFSAEGDYFIRRIDSDGGFESATDQGLRVQGGVFLIPDFIEVAGRYALIAFDDDVDGRDKRWEITPGVNFYFSGHKYKVQLSYSLISDEDTGGDEVDQNVFRAQFQAYF